MKSLNDIKQIVKNTKVKPRSEMRSKVLDDALELQRKRNRQSASDTHTWKIIMTSKMTKIAAAAVIILVLGLVPINGTTALGKVAHGVTSTLSRLKAAMLGEESVGQDVSAGRSIDKSVKINTRTRIYTTSDESLLESALNENDISLVSVDSGDAKYAVIPPDEIDSVRKLLRSSSIKAVASPTIMTFGGQEAMLWMSGEDTQKSVGVAITAYKDEDEQLNMDFAFHNTDNGCQVDGIILAEGQALLISGVKTDTDEFMIILCIPEIQNE